MDKRRLAELSEVITRQGLRVKQMRRVLQVILAHSANADKPQEELLFIHDLAKGELERR